MSSESRLCVVVAAILLDACNMVLSETPMFTEADRGAIAPKNGVWVNDDEECRFDSSRSESDWPQCATWVIVRGLGEKIILSDGKGQTEQFVALLSGDDPTILQAHWVDTAKDSRAYYGFYGVEPHDAGSDGRFSAASMWGVDCGNQNQGSSEIQPFPGITPECRPTSRDAIRSAAKLSRKADDITQWR
ncbi:MAG: hypothetical protein ABIS23_00540 [Sphingomicrobium sp.]